MRLQLAVAFQAAFVAAILLTLAEPPEASVNACIGSATLEPSYKWNTISLPTATMAVVSEVATIPTPTEGITHAVPEVSIRPTLTGVASWYRYVVGHAAAGPALRAFLGDNWRGQTVTVTMNGRSVSVKLSDWCQCYEGERSERIIDLDDRAFAALAPVSRGLIQVTVSPD